MAYKYQNINDIALAGATFLFFKTQVEESIKRKGLKCPTAQRLEAERVANIIKQGLCERLK